MFDSLVVGLIATAVTDHMDAAEKIRERLRRKRFSEDIDALSTEFIISLQETTGAALTEHQEITSQEIEWTAVAKRLDQTEVMFKSEEEAVKEITKAIGESIETDLNDDPNTRESLEAAVADTYRDTLRLFASRISQGELVEDFNTIAKMEMIMRLNELNDQQIGQKSQPDFPETVSINDEFSHGLKNKTETDFDAFICHASEDKESFVRPLAEELTEMGLNIWYDEFELGIGDSIRQSIDEGLSNSAFGVVVLSDQFFQKEWTQYELNALTAKEMASGKTIIPIWYGIEQEKIMNHSPRLADKLAIKVESNEVSDIAQSILKVIRDQD